MAKDWDKENMKSLATNVKKDTAVRFQLYAREHDTTVGALLRGFIEATVTGSPMISEDGSAARIEPIKEPIAGVNGWGHVISFRNEDLLKAEVAHHNPDGLNPEEMLNQILSDYFRFVRYARR